MISPLDSPVWHDVSDVGVDPLPVEDQASGRENEDTDLADGRVGELAHDETAGGEAEGRDDGEGELDGHHDVEEVVQHSHR